MTRKNDELLRLRIMAAGRIAMGPGKAQLLEGVRETGSISAAGRGLRMSYKRAWQLIDEMNTCFREPVVTTSTGGSGGGGATLTPMGEQVLALYRRVEQRCADAAAQELAELARRLA